ncbi:DUF6178 family protein [Desulfuromonas sp. KJ2020]|uniref:DUF6178 family protein n=1 Tax=Desulfuromonas sp. KJ2020 TaxID=2919173 RepID=UPI0020A7E540|nr:DUF6178 family protein [Desulfuromonas sp. KJ2020]MCP3176979.1 DUF6178 family protein [Desulfuromonas sp. KJ2020]
MENIELPGRKKVGHLTLHRDARTITPKEFNLLSQTERLEIVRRASGSHKYNLIIEAKDPAALVRKLPSQEVYLLLRERGLEESTELIELLTPAQIGTFIDLDCWQGDQMKPEAVLNWLVLLLETKNEQQVLQLAQGMEFELLAMMLKRFVTVTRGLEAFEDDDALQEAIFRDGGYELEFADSESAKIVGAFLDILRRLAPEFYPRLMEAVRWESEAMLEEETYQNRCSRLQDLGIPDPFEALKVYAYLDPEQFTGIAVAKKDVRAGQADVVPPGFILTVSEPGDLLAEVLADGLDEPTCWELTYLLNKVMSADRVDVGETEQIQGEMTEIFHYLNLALQHLAGGDVETAARQFRENYLENLFRLGFSLTLQLQRRAKDLLASPLAPYLDGPFRALTDALCQRQPRFFEGLLEVNRGGQRPFTNLSEVTLAGEWLDRLEVQRQLFTEQFPFALPEAAALDLSGCMPDAAEDLALSDFFLTALANRLLGRTFVPEPIDADELPGLHALVSEGGQLRPALRQETAQWLESLVPGGGAFADYCLDLWQEEFCTLKPEDIDPRYVGGLIVRLG